MSGCQKSRNTFMWHAFNKKLFILSNLKSFVYLRWRMCNFCNQNYCFNIIYANISFSVCYDSTALVRFSRASFRHIFFTVKLASNILATLYFFCSMHQFWCVVNEFERKNGFQQSVLKTAIKN